MLIVGMAIYTSMYSARQHGPSVEGSGDKGVELQSLDTAVT